MPVGKLVMYQHSRKHLVLKQCNVWRGNCGRRTGVAYLKQAKIPHIFTAGLIWKGREGNVRAKRGDQGQPLSWLEIVIESYRPPEVAAGQLVPHIFTANPERVQTAGLAVSTILYL